jgi:hypothetical protein
MSEFERIRTEIEEKRIQISQNVVARKSAGVKTLGRKHGKPFESVLQDLSPEASA